MQASRLVLDLADMHQRTTQSYVRRPYGVGMLVAAHDQTGPHLFQTCPSGNYFEYVAMAIGARSQSAKTYLEKHFESFEVCTKGKRKELYDVCRLRFWWTPVRRWFVHERELNLERGCTFVLIWKLCFWPAGVLNFTGNGDPSL